MKKNKNPNSSSSSSSSTFHHNSINIMLIPTLKCLTKIRPLSFLFISNPFSSLAAACPSPLPPQNPYPQFPDISPDRVITSFKTWFKTAHNPLIDRIFEILSSFPDDDEIGSGVDDLALARLGFRLDEGFVLEVLRYGSHDGLSCVKFFDWAGRQPGFFHTRNTFNAIFRVLARAKIMRLSLDDFLEKFVKERYIHRVRFNNTLVMGYAVAGKPLTALQVFGRMRYQGQDLDPFEYHVLLNALVETGCFDGAEVVLAQIKMRGFENDVSNTIEMKRFCKQGLLDEAERFLRGLLGAGDKVSGYLLGLLIDALCKQNRFAYGGQLMEEFREKGNVSMEQAYSVWIRRLVQSGKVDNALEFLHQKNSLDGYVPEVFRYNMLISKLLRGNRVQEVYDLLTEMNEYQLVPDKVTMNVALCFFCKIGMVDVALELYKSRSEYGLTPNSMAYNYLINTLCGDETIEEACQIMINALDKGYFPGKMTFSILSDALRREGKLDKMKELVKFALTNGVGISNSTYDKFIYMLCQTNGPESAYVVHSAYSTLNKVLSGKTYGSLIKGFAELRKGEIAERFLLEMQEKGHTPARNLFRVVICCLCYMDDPQKRVLNLLKLQVFYYKPSTTIYNHFIDGAGHGKQPDLAREIYESMGTSGIIPNLSSDILMLQSYLKNGRISDALIFFDEVGRKREVRRKLFNAMIDGLCKANRSHDALVILKDITSKGLIPSLRSYEEIIRLLAAENKYEHIMKIINELEAMGRNVSPFIGNVLVYQSLKFRGLYEAWLRTRVSNQETQSSIMLGQMLSAFSSHVTENSNVKDLEQAILECFPPDIFSYNMLLRRLCMNKIDEAIEFFKEICQKGYVPNRWTYDIIVHGLAKHGRLAEARRWEKIMYDLGFEPTDATISLLHQTQMRT